MQPPPHGAAAAGQAEVVDVTTTTTTTTTDGATTTGPQTLTSKAIRGRRLGGRGRVYGESTFTLCGGENRTF